MNKIIFQLGLFAFFASAVFFGTEGLSTLDAIFRAFLVLVGVVVAATLFLIVGSMISTNRKSASGETSREQEPARRESKVPRRPQQTAVPATK